MDRPADAATEGAKYQYDDGTVEIVFAAEEGRVLTVREYPDEAGFTEGVEPATYIGHHAALADLPGVDAFAEGGADSVDGAD